MADVLSQRFGQPDFGFATGTPAFTNHTVDASNEGVAWCLQAQDAEPITHLGFRYGSRTGTPPSFVIGLESPSATTGFPDGTVLGGGSPASAIFTPPANATWDGTWQWIALDNAYTPTRGQFICPTIRYSSGTIDGSNNSAFTIHMTGVGGANIANFPYPLRNISGTWGFLTQPPVAGVRTATSRYGRVVQSTYTTRSSGTIGHRLAMEFSLPLGAAASFTVRGIRFTGGISAASGKNPVLGLWSASGVLQNVTLDSDVMAANPASATSFTEYLFDESTLATLTPGTTYYAGLEVADAVSAGVVLYSLSVASADDMACYPGGATWRLASYDGSSWTPNTTTRPLMELILGDVTGGGGSGGGYPILMAGGIVR